MRFCFKKETADLEIFLISTHSSSSLPFLTSKTFLGALNSRIYLNQKEHTSYLNFSTLVE